MTTEPQASDRPIDKCWQFNRNTGFLLAPDPVVDIRLADTGLEAESVEMIYELHDAFPALVRADELRKYVDQLALFSMAAPIANQDGRVLERLFQIYAHAANAYVWCDESDPADVLPAAVAVPLVELANALGRPPILAYASTSISNFQRVAPEGPFSVDNMTCLQELIGTPDEAWFHLIHVEIEWHAAGAVGGCLDAATAAEQGDTAGVRLALEQVPPALDRMIKTFKRIGEQCSTEYYYRTLRPYLFGFTDVVYAGVEEFGERPRSFRGESGAQSTVIPVVQRLLGLNHAHGGLTDDLDAMVAYMPLPHQAILRASETRSVRPHVEAAADQNLTDVYNACLEGVLEFRSLHLNMARAYIASKVENPTGTGGTDFMVWLTQLRDETKEQLL